MNSAYSQDILKFIDADSNYFNPPTAKKFARAGAYFADLAEALDYSSQRWLNEWLNESYGENEYCEVEHDWSDWLASRTQQSVSVAFLEKYRPCDRHSNNYPETRASWGKDPVLDVEPETDLAAAISTAHAEDISLWSSLVFEAIADVDSMRYSQLTQFVDLTPAQIFLSVFLSDRFSIVRDDERDFYGGFRVIKLQQLN